ncbi:MULTISPECIES: OmpA family protein [unclassified Mesorhizobium]|uniref:OmpA family protein n=1 Tax=unclassified Mesorhizobium TaxID=325217 RepID=UPI000FC9E8DB|nr:MULTISPECIES: OmpA family protein [unclassified Mesorhizobium]RUX34648.1 OmpA family protein [Mesorhizobium sp. M2A.F.Ca.ET.042.01.1.1]RWD63891.1 MAG: OmpA family protein [Mesorhizobium sp.]TIV56787.1 MAG: OmpA family protein [Mesorhizobium sp.]
MDRMIENTRRLLAASLLVLTASCSTSNTLAPSTPDVTNAEIAAFQNVQPGSEEDFILNVGRRTYFTKGSAALDSVAKTTLDTQIAWLAKYPRWLLKLQGFADDPGANETALSQQRADAVMGYLAAGGIDRSRMWAKGYGKDRLVRDCPDTACRSQNRRVVSNLRDERDEP